MESTVFWPVLLYTFFMIAGISFVILLIVLVMKAASVSSEDLLPCRGEKKGAAEKK